jgi:hypothetical protein
MARRDEKHTRQAKKILPAFNFEEDQWIHVRREAQAKWFCRLLFGHSKGKRKRVGSFTFP